MWRGTYSQVPWGEYVMGRGGHRESNRERRGSERDKRDIKKKRQRSSESSKIIERRGENRRESGGNHGFTFIF